MNQKQNNTYLTPLDRLIFSVRFRQAKRYAEKQKNKRELYKIKYGRYPQRRKALGFSKWFAIAMSIMSAIVVFFSMYCTVLLQDSSMLVALIGGLITGTITIVSSTWKSTQENTIGGIVYESAMRDYETTILSNENRAG